MSVSIVNSNSAALVNAQKNVLNRSNAWETLVNNGTLHKDDYIRFAEDSEKYRRHENVVVADLIAAGLTTEADISETLVHYQTMNKFEANVSMNASNQETNQSDYIDSYIPLPIFSSPFKIPFRQGRFAYKQRDGMMEAFEAVNDLQDRVMIKGADIQVQVSGAPVNLYGFTNHPSAITSTISDWADSANSDAVTGEAVGLVGQLFDGAKVASPDTVMMYVATDVWQNLENDYSSQKGDRTILERLRAITAIMDVKPQKDLDAGDVLLVEMRPRTVQLALAQQAVAIPHIKDSDIDDGRFTVYSAMTPKIKTDRNGSTGIVYASKV